MACGGAFYMLGEVEFIIAAEHATFFDPHVSFGMTACFESMHMLQKMPFGEIMRVALLGASERMTAQRAHEIGLVSEVVAGDALHDAAAWAATEIAKSPPIAIQGTVRALWMAREMSRKQALDAGRVLIRLGSDPKSLLEGQRAFASGERIKPRTRCETRRRRRANGEPRAKYAAHNEALLRRDFCCPSLTATNRRIP